MFSELVEKNIEICQDISWETRHEYLWLIEWQSPCPFVRYPCRCAGPAWPLCYYSIIEHIYNHHVMAEPFENKVVTPWTVPQLLEYIKYIESTFVGTRFAGTKGIHGNIGRDQAVDHYAFR